MFLNSALEIDYKNIFAGLHIYYISMDAKSNLHSSSVFFFSCLPCKYSLGSESQLLFLSYCLWCNKDPSKQNTPLIILVKSPGLQISLQVHRCDQRHSLFDILIMKYELEWFIPWWWGNHQTWIRN